MMNYLYSSPIQIIRRSNYSEVNLSCQISKDKTNVEGSDASKNENDFLLVFYLVITNLLH